MAFVLTPDRRALALPLGAAKEIDRLILRWRATVSEPPHGGAATPKASEQACRDAGGELRARIWDPVGSHLGAAARVLVVPDGLLHLVSLAALPVGASGYLVEAGPVLHYLSAERDLAEPPAARAAGGGLLAFGGPSFDRSAPSTAADSGPSARGVEPEGAGGAQAVLRGAPPDCAGFRSIRFPPLPETAREVRDIAADWGASGDALVLTGTDATELAFKAGAPGRRVVHVATHGFFLDGRCGAADLPRSVPVRGIGGVSVSRPSGATRPGGGNPLRLSGLALAGANRRARAGPGEEDGILTAEEIASLDLSRAEWVVLSACDTGLGEIQAGEGVLGLRRSFQIAGAGTVIMSLWAIEDRAGREWMRELYRDRFRGDQGTADAVREASLSVLRGRRAQASSTHPFYWAGFVAAGDWR
jgi:CHAT domain-containing protein